MAARAWAVLMSLVVSGPAPKVTPVQLARSVVQALRQGIETVALGPVAEDIVQRWRDDPMLLERELTQVARSMEL